MCNPALRDCKFVATIFETQMLTEIFNSIQSTLKDTLGFSMVEEYKGQFEDGSEWTPEFPCVFIQVDNPYIPMPAPGGRAADNTVTKFKLTYTLYCGDKGTLLTLAMLETITDAFNGKSFNVLYGDPPEQNMIIIRTSIIEPGAPLLGYVKGLGAIHYVTLEIFGPHYTSFVITVPDQVILSSPADGSTTVAYDNADLAWTAITGMTYMLQIAVDVNFNTVIFEQDGIKYVNFTVPEGILSPDIQYYWRVRAWNKYQWGAWSTVRHFTTAEAVLIPEVPTLVSPADAITLTDYSPINFQWNQSARAETYVFQIASDIAFTSLIVNQAGLTATTYIYTPLTSNTIRYWRVKAVNSHGESAWS